MNRTLLMNTAPGNENKDPKVPADPGAGGTPPAPEAKTVTLEEALEVIKELDTVITKTQDEIVRLKREKKPGDPASDDRIAELEKTIADQNAKIEDLRKNGITREEASELQTEITRVRKRSSEIMAAAVSKDTTGAGAGAGGAQPDAPRNEGPARSSQDEAVLARLRARRIAEGRDPETGLKKK